MEHEKKLYKIEIISDADFEVIKGLISEHFQNFEIVCGDRLFSVKDEEMKNG